MEGRRAWVAIGCVVAWLVIGILLVAQFGCARSPPAMPKVLDVRVTAMPARRVCWLEARPDPPKLKELDHEIEDVLKRTMVHWHDYNELILYMQQMHEWSGDMEDCIEQITGEDP